MKSIPNPKSLIFIPVILLVMTTAGCNSEPSQDEIDRTVTQFIEHSSQQFPGMTSGLTDGLVPEKAMTPTVHSVKKLFCAEENSNDTYNCRIETDISTDIARKKAVVNLLLTRDEGGWHILDILQ